MSINPSSNGTNGRKSKNLGTASDPATSAEEYKIGYGRPPREKRWLPGTSGNPKGRKPKPPSMELDLKLALEKALNRKIKVKQGDRERIVTMATAGIEQLVAQFAKGDPRARRDVIELADRFGLDLLAGQRKEIRESVAQAARASSAGILLTEELLDRLDIGTLDNIIAAETKLQAEKKKMH